MRTHKVNENYFNKIDNIDKAYALGFIAADGCIVEYKSKYRLHIKLNKKDVCILEKIKNLLEFEGNIKLVENIVYLNVYSKKLCLAIMKFNINPRKSLTMPNMLNKIPEEYRHAFIAGYFDGDGTVGLYKRGDGKSYKYRVSIYGTKEFLMSICNYLEIPQYISNVDYETNHTKNINDLQIQNKKDITKFYLKIMDKYQSSLTRKREKFNEVIRYINRI